MSSTRIGLYLRGWACDLLLKVYLAVSYCPIYCKRCGQYNIYAIWRTLEFTETVAVKKLDDYIMEFYSDADLVYPVSMIVKTRQKHFII